MKRFLLAVAAFSVGYVLAYSRPRHAPPPQTDVLGVSVVSQGSVFPSPGELAPGIADPGDGVLRVDYRRGPETHTAFYPVKGR